MSQKIAAEIQQSVALHIGTLTLQLIEQQAIIKDQARQLADQREDSPRSGVDDA